jgi:hypothetical protein
VASNVLMWRYVGLTKQSADAATKAAESAYDSFVETKNNNTENRRSEVTLERE